MIRRDPPWVCLVTDRHRLSPAPVGATESVSALRALIEEAAAAGVDVLQIRERDLESAVLRELLGLVADQARQHGTAVVVNDRADLAWAAGADGVHLRGDGPPVDRVRSWAPTTMVIGRSIHEPEEAARESAADYLIFGTVFPSASKPGGAAAGADRLRRAVRDSRVPVLAIGGIEEPWQAEACGAAGAQGIAAVGVFARAAGRPGRMADIVRDLRDAVARGQCAASAGSAP